MKEWRKVYRCKNCLKIYPYELHETCNKCGSEIGKRELNIPFIPGMTIRFSSYSDISEVVPNENCEIVTARRKFFKWEVKENANPAN